MLHKPDPPYRVYYVDREEKKEGHDTVEECFAALLDDYEAAGRDVGGVVGKDGEWVYHGRYDGNFAEFLAEQEYDWVPEQL